MPSERLMRNKTLPTTNLIRASFGQSLARGRRAVGEIRESVSPGAFQRLIRVIGWQPQGRRVLLQNRLTPAEIHRGVLFDPLPLAREAVWCAAQLQPFLKTLKDFRGRAVLLDEDFFKPESLENHWYKDFERLGHSLWLIELKFAWHQKSEGLDGQKKYLGELQSAEVHGLTNALALFWSQRNEPVVQYSSFLSRVDSFITELDAPREYEDYIRFFLLRTLPDDPQRLSNILRIAQVSSPIDAYELLIEVIAHCVASDSPNLLAPDWLDHILEMLRPVEDARLTVAWMRRRLTDKEASSESDPLLPEEMAEDLKRLRDRQESAPQAAGRLLKSGLNCSPLRIGRVGSEMSRGYVAPTYSETIRQGRRVEVLGHLRPASSILRSIAEPSTNSPQRMLLEAKLSLEKLAGSQDWWQSLKQVATVVAKFPSAEGEFEVDHVLSSHGWSELRQFADQPELCILLAVSYRRSPGSRSSEKLSDLQFATLELLKAWGARLYSDLLSLDIDTDMLVFLGRFVFIEEVMERSPEISTSRGLSEERMRVLQVLARIDDRRASTYMSEIKEITYSLEVKEGAQYFDRSRIYVDVDGLKRWASGAISDDFDRFQALQASSGADVGAIDSALAELRRYILDPEAGLPRQILESGSTEADRLFEQMIVRLRQEFLFNAVNGLDVFLSVRVRHGSFSGNLKAPLEEAGLNPHHRGSSKKNAQASAIWAQLEGLGHELAASLHTALLECWTQIGGEVQEFARRQIQIKGANNPEGMIECPLTRFHINLLKLETFQEVGIEGFVDRCVQIFYVSVAFGLEKLRQSLVVEFKERIDSILGVFSDDARRLLESFDAPLLFDALARSRTMMAYSIERVASWFVVPESQVTGKTYSFAQIVEISLQVTKNARVGFAPHLLLDINDSLPPFSIGSGAFIVADALFIMFDNVFLHSGINGRPNIELTVGAIEDGAILIRMENDVAAEVEQSSSERLDEIRALIEKGEVSVRSRHEGGSGLLKLSAIGAKSEIHHGRSNLRFGFTGEKFFIEFVLPVRTMESAGHANSDC